MKDEGGNFYVRVGQCLLRVGVQDQHHGDVWQPGGCNMMVNTELEGSIHTTPAPMLEASKNSRWVGSWKTISSRQVGQSEVCVTSGLQS